MPQHHGKRFKKLVTDYDRKQLFSTTEAVALVKKNANAKFNETVEAHIRLGVDPKKSDQNVRGTVLLPHGTGRTVRVIAFAKGDNAKAAQEAGADIVGDQDLIDKVKAGFTEFDVAVATPDMMAQVGKELGRVLAQKMPNPKAGTVTPNIGAAIRDIKAGKVEFRLDKTGIIHTIVGKANFDEKQLLENVSTLLDAIVRAKPAAAKGTYLRSVTLTSTMGPGVKVDPNRIKATA
ncbi:MAG: 50S ribosomal protein L1 [Candidatus Eremiobacteraeota bacterium]|nr:50S ribosomal protein L1 [Candidatus Eremiobacteraeota bacterium]MBV8435288.1 50S ribosomal protein L1 [Candidatus Eremiobacteraeota bacterium]MBV8720646.1 50S ribosomal protein L1 [Candidatus Eremiobacteraeota bacterium]